MSNDISPAERMRQGLKALGWLPVAEGEELPFRRLRSSLHPINNESGEYAGNVIVGFFEDRPDESVTIFVPALDLEESAGPDDTDRPAGRIPPQEEIEAITQGLSIPVDSWRTQ